MTLGDRLQRWWDRVRGQEPPEANAGARRGNDGSAAARPIGSLPNAGAGSPVKLSLEGRPTRGPRQPRYRETGFDPYSSTGGYGKLRGWDDVARK